jgi:hypothetical protein
MGASPPEDIDISGALLGVGLAGINHSCPRQILSV